ncbi:MAG: ribosome small subunit-dependent GTPase A [Clostridia bacterium]|nr:ribosome small subunit-dependent GTPase A [Clostridia bacterium]
MEDKILKGIIMTSVGGRYNVRITSAGADGFTVKNIPARGVFRNKKITPLCADRVEVKKNADGYCIFAVEERKNELIRPPLANLDLLYIVASVKDPDMTEGFADKLTVLCEKNGIKPVIVMTKSELDRTAAAKTVSMYKETGYGAFAVSSVTGEGVKELLSHIKGQTGCVSAFCGVSGAGKSTLLNTLFPGLGCETGQISEKIRRGKNTTRRVTLFEIENGTYIADTPGFSLLDFVRFDFCTKEELPYLFPEFEPYLCKCRYTKCSHTKEDGCLIREAVAEGKIPESRYASYLSIYEDVKDKKEWMK